jgi:hypothetical protein
VDSQDSTSRMTITGSGIMGSCLLASEYVVERDSDRECNVMIL